jgi:peptide/nickel transport system permease protein
MAAFIVRRTAVGLITLIIVSMILFFVMRLLPGDPLSIFIGRSAASGIASSKQIETLRVEYGLDKPLPVQYLRWLGGVLRGDLGTSIFYHENVGKLILERLPMTVFLDIWALLLSTVLGVALGTAAAAGRGTWIDALIGLGANVGIAAPPFLLGILMIYFFGVRLGWLPIAGYTLPWDNIWLSLRQSVMPVICLSLFNISAMERQMRSSMLEVIGQDFVRTARAKGLGEARVLSRHVFKNSLIPVITLFGGLIGYVIAGSVVVEQVFAIPGVGRLLVSSILSQDYVVIQSSFMIIALVIVTANLLVEISYAWIDPRIRYS